MPGDGIGCEYYSLGHVAPAGAAVQLGVAQGTYPHPLGPQPWTHLMLRRLKVKAAITNHAPIMLTLASPVAATGVNIVFVLQPGEGDEILTYNPGERFRLGRYWVFNDSADPSYNAGDYMEVSCVQG